MKQTIHFDLDLIRRYDKAGPRYTSYPTAVQFHEGFAEQQYRQYALRSNESGRPLSLYFHLPFCDTVCYYCACNKIVTKDRGKALPYLDALYKEIAMQGELFDRSRPVNQLHWGGGTPTFLSDAQMTELMQVTGRYFNLRDDDQGEYSIEIDPREVQENTIQTLRAIGFNRMSMGVQDFEPKVQKAVNRIQPEKVTLDVLASARAAGFRSISLDLIYGLPFQTVDTFARTLEKIIEIDPDRLSIFNYAHLPELFKPQRRINAEELPEPAEKLDILQYTINRLLEAGYVYIGMDHFAKPDDELAIAQRNRTLYRNFQGYSTHADCDMVSMGVTSIGMVGNSYSQNLKKADDYYACIESGKLPIYRGYELSQDDVLRREVITNLICHFVLDIQQIETKYNICFADYFAIELEQLQQMQHDGLLQLDQKLIEVEPAGRLLIRNICMVFDRYLREKREQRYSRVI